MQHTEQSLAATGKLFEAIASVKPDKSALAAIVAETFINGMNARESLMSHDSERERPST